MRRSSAAPGTHRLLRGGEQCEVIGLRLPVPFAHHLARLARESSDGPRIFADFSSKTTDGEQRTGLLYAPADVADEHASCLKVLLERVDMECGRRERAGADERVVSRVKWSAVFDQSALAVLDKLPKAPKAPKRAEKSSPKAPTAVIAQGPEELPVAAPPTRRRRTAAPTTQVITPASRLRSPVTNRRASPLRLPSPVSAGAGAGSATATLVPPAAAATPTAAEPHWRTPGAPKPAAQAPMSAPAAAPAAAAAAVAKGLAAKQPAKQLRDMTVKEGIEALKTPIVTLGTYGITAHAHAVVSERNVVLRKALADAHSELQQLAAQLDRLQAEAAREDELRSLLERVERHVRERRGELARLSSEMSDVDAALAIGRDSLQHYADTHKELCQASATTTT